MKKVLTVAALVTTAVTTAVITPATAGATSCATPWGSQPKGVTAAPHAGLVGMRAGRHECYDRLVIDLSRSDVGYRVRYVSAVRDQGRGAVVPLRGGAFLQVDLQASAAKRPAMPDVAGYRTFRQVAWGGSFEGYSTVGLGVRARLPFRVFRNGSDLVVDVAHAW